MGSINAKLVGGVALIFLGGILLLQNNGFLHPGDLIWGLIFLFGGILLISLFMNNRGNWWLLIPGYIFLGISCLFILGFFFPQTEEVIGGSIFLAAIGLAFINIYIVEKQNWWAIIPAGVLLTISIVVGLDYWLKDIEVGGILFFGMGITFAALPLLPIPQKTEMKWAWIPAGVLFMIGLIIIGISHGVIQIIGSFLLILLGIFFIIRTFRKKI